MVYIVQRLKPGKMQRFPLTVVIYTSLNFNMAQAVAITPVRCSVRVSRGAVVRTKKGLHDLLTYFETLRNLFFDSI